MILQIYVTKSDTYLYTFGAFCSVRLKSEARLVFLLPQVSAEHLKVIFGIFFYLKQGVAKILREATDRFLSSGHFSKPKTSSRKLFGESIVSYFVLFLVPKLEKNLVFCSCEVFHKNKKFGYVSIACHFLEKSDLLSVGHRHLQISRFVIVDLLTTSLKNSSLDCWNPCTKIIYYSRILWNNYSKFLISNPIT